MSFFGAGNQTINSTTIGLTANPTTAALLAEVDLNSTQFAPLSGGQRFQVTWIVTAQTTNAVFLCDHALSTGLGATGIITQIPAALSSGNVAQLMTKHNINAGERFRIRVASTFTGSVAGTIIAEPMD